MKRDMELVRKILIDISMGNFILERFEKDDIKGMEKNHLIAYHLKIMAQAGLIEVEIKLDYANNYFLTRKPMLTWEGNDYLDAISNDSVWIKTKKSIKEKGLELGNVPFNVLKEFVALQIKQFLGME